MTLKDIIKATPITTSLTNKQLLGKLGCVYYIKITDTLAEKIYYKIGTTSTTVEARIESLTKDRPHIHIKILDTYFASTATIALNIEKSLHHRYKHKLCNIITSQGHKHYMTITKPIVKPLSSGNTELYSEDILGLDNI
jgi:hypothetical protein